MYLLKVMEQQMVFEDWEEQSQCTAVQKRKPGEPDDVWLLSLYFDSIVNK